MSFDQAIAKHVNGTRGRAVPALPEHTFKDSGITVRLRKIAPTTQQRFAEQVQKELPKPAPPVVTTELGPEENPADPAYEAALKDWNQQCAVRLNERLFTFACLECDLELDDEARQEIARKKRNLDLAGLLWEPNPRLSDEENDRVFYIQHIACSTTEALGEFYQAITARSTPTEAAVQRHIDSFPGDVPGEGHL